MIQVKQTIMGMNGNCFQAAVASVLEVGIEDIYIQKSENWFDEFCDFIKNKYSLTYVEFGVKELSTEIFRSGRNDVYHIIIMNSPRVEGQDHAVVGKNGMPFFDPVTGENVQISGFPQGEDQYLIGLFLK